MYVGPSHKVVDKLTKLIGDHDDMEAHHSPSKEGPLLSTRLATLTLRRSLFLENADTIRDIARDCVKMYSHIDEEAQREFFEESNSEPFNAAYLEKLLDKNQPAKVFLRNTFRQVIGFITSQNRASFSEPINYLLSFVNELRVAHGTQTHEDKRLIKSLSENSVATVLDTISKDAPLFLYWACIEVARYCVDESNISKDIDTDDFLLLLTSELSNPGKFSEKYSRRFFVIFIQSLEKALSYDLETSLRRSSFVSSTSSKTHILYNQMLHKWIVCNREKIADLSLRINDPAQCWRNIDIRLSDDLTVKQKSFTSMGADNQFKRAPGGSWRKNLPLIAEAAIQLNDIDLLYGIESLANDSGLICDFPPLRPMISNLRGNFEQTYRDHMRKCSELDEQSLNEFLKACVEINLLKENATNVDLLQSDWLKDSYKKLIKPTDETQRSLETRLLEVEHWLKTWSDSPDPLNIDLIMSTYLKTVSKTPQELLPASHYDAEWFLSQDFIAQTLFSPSLINGKFKIYNVIFNMLRLNDEDRHIPISLVKIHSKNYRWNSDLFRHVRDLNWLDLLRQQDDTIDLVQYRAIKYHHRCKNNLTTMKLSEDLLSNGTSCTSKIECSLLLVADAQPSNIDRFRDILGQIDLSTLNNLVKNDLRSKVLRYILRGTSRRAADSLILGASYEAGNLNLETSDELTGWDWQDILDSSGPLSKLRSLSLISEICHEKSKTSSQTEQSISSLFKLDVALLKQLNQYKLAKYNSSAVKCAIRILKCIRENHSKLNQDAAQLLACQVFQEQTIQTWILIKSNLISLVSDDKSDLPTLWRKALTELVKVIVRKHPNVLLYCLIVQRLESKLELRPGWSSRPPKSSLKQDERLDLWQELYTYMTSITNTRTDDWLKVIQETEGFVREMRRISYLCGENLFALSSELIKKLVRFMDRMHKQIASGCGQFPTDSVRQECEARFRSICEHAVSQMDVLLLYSRGPNPDTYGTWFKSDLNRRLHRLRYLVQHLIDRLLPFNQPKRCLSDMQSYVGIINDSLVECKQLISNYSNRLWMHLISPKLSRLGPGDIPMPGCCSDPCNFSKQTITIHKVSQTVEMIASKTSPKRLVLVGSDGIARSFLLKAHEDLRQDQYMMGLFTIINKFLSGQKETQNLCRLRNYAVTPISSKSGLIEWVNAPALMTFCRKWLASPSGRRVIEDLYASTCRMVCGTAEVRGAPKSNHENCRTPRDLHMVGIFHQILWAKAKQVDLNQTELTKRAPTQDNSLRYRAEFEPCLFQGVLEHLIDRVPSDLISNSLWHRSINSNSYWRKTKQFTHSCATISMVGYIMGLGDRHLGNILLDHDTGEVIHIDFNCWFELGKKQSLPEQVPFRLTHNLIRAFGFAGLEGGFTRTSQKVLNLLREHKSTLLHLLEPTNWLFMVASPNSSEIFWPGLPADTTLGAATTDSNSDNSASSIKLDQLSKRMQTTTDQLLVSPSQVETPESQVNNSQLAALSTGRELNMFDNDDGYGISKRLQLGSIDYDEKRRPFLNDLHVNIRTPTKIVEGVASKMFKRIEDKLSGADKQLAPIIASKASLRSERDDGTGSPVIVLDDSQSTDDQVDALIIEATSLKNNAAMYEGWMSWV